MCDGMAGAHVQGPEPTGQAQGREKPQRVRREAVPALPHPLHGRPRPADRLVVERTQPHRYGSFVFILMHATVSVHVCVEKGSRQNERAPPPVG